ncbi:MAG: hypothetical protein K6G28_01760 [Acholeplasmatales bacterium]|nr:hypothetical protein [Acholeplasmatales bacterium]
MAKKIIKISSIILGVCLAIFLVIISINTFKSTTSRLIEIFDISNLKNCFEIYIDKSSIIYEESVKEVESNVSSFVESVSNAFDKPFEEVILDFLNSFFDFLLNFIIYFCNYGLNVILLSYIFFHETISGTQEKIRTTPLAYSYYCIIKTIDMIKIKTVKGIKYVLNIIYKYRRIIAGVVLIVITANGWLYKVLVELLIFLITYIVRMINLETYILVFQIIQAAFIFVYPKLKYIPTFIWIPLLIILIFLKAVSRAEYRLKKNHQRLREFVSDELTQTCFINGCPGTGKTLLNMSLSLACEENFIDDLESQLLNYEIKYKNLNFAEVRRYPKKYPEHSEYIKIYKLLNDRKSFIISNYAIYSPMFEDYSKIFNFDYMRVNKKTDLYPLEEYIIISLSEFDKEYNSHDDKKVVGEDGAATFFSTVSHDLKRHAKIFVDYQLRQQVPLRIRGNSEYFIRIQKRKKKYPLLLFIYYLPFLGLYKLLKYFLKKYELKKKRVERKSTRYGKATYKRNDITLLYAILRRLSNVLQRICNWFDQYYYFKLSTTISQEDENDSATKGTKKSLCINIRDLSYKNQRLYDSTFLSYSYEEKKNQEFKDLDTFTKLSPSKYELAKCHSRFYDKINN